VPALPEHAACHIDLPELQLMYRGRPREDQLEVFAPFGLADLFAMHVRPNPILAPAAVYEAKTKRWVQEWPQLTVLPWPTDVNHGAD